MTSITSIGVGNGLEEHNIGRNPYRLDSSSTAEQDSYTIKVLGASPRSPTMKNYKKKHFSITRKHLRKYGDDLGDIKIANDKRRIKKRSASSNSGKHSALNREDGEHYPGGAQ